MTRIALIDGDMALWKVCSFGGGDDIHSRACAMIGRLRKDTASTDVIVCFSDPTRAYWRKAIWPIYKDDIKPLPDGYDEAKAAMKSKFVTRVLPGMEADDLMGILATSDKLPGEKVIVSDDKDLRTIPGKRYSHGKRQMFDQSVQSADYFWLLQTLMGDPTDSYPGLPGVGPVKASAILSEAEQGPGFVNEAWGCIVKAYESKGLTESDALKQAQVARICRESDFDYSTRQAIPWRPAA